MEEGRTKYTTMSKTEDSSEVYHSTEKPDKAPSLQLRTMQNIQEKGNWGLQLSERSTRPRQCLRHDCDLSHD